MTNGTGPKERQKVGQDEKHVKKIAVAREPRVSKQPTQQTEKK